MICSHAACAERQRPREGRYGHVASAGRTHGPSQVASIGFCITAVQRKAAPSGMESIKALLLGANQGNPPSKPLQENSCVDSSEKITLPWMNCVIYCKEMVIWKDIHRQGWITITLYIKVIQVFSALLPEFEKLKRASLVQAAEAAFACIHFKMHSYSGIPWFKTKLWWHDGSDHFCRWC